MCVSVWVGVNVCVNCERESENDGSSSWRQSSDSNMILIFLSKTKTNILTRNVLKNIFAKLLIAPKDQKTIFEEILFRPRPS